MSSNKHDQLSRREALGAIAAFACVNLIDGCGGSDTPVTSPIVTTPTTPPPPTPPATYAVTGDYITPFTVVEPVSGLTVPCQLFVPAGAKPSVPGKLFMWSNGAGQRGATADLSIAAGNYAGQVVTPNKSTYPWFGMFMSWPAGPDQYTRYGRSAFMQCLNYVLQNYNIDNNHLHLGGYSFGAIQTISLALRYPKLFASLSIFDGVPVAFNLINGVDTASDLLDPTLYPCKAGSWGIPALDPTYQELARAEWCRRVGDIPINYQHGALDGKSPAGSLIPPTAANDFVVRGNDPMTDPNPNVAGSRAWNVSLLAAGQTGFTTVNAVASPSPKYSTSLKRVYVPYTAYDHGGLNSGFPYAMGTPYWDWMLARTGRTEYV